jgi:hypothetical protein
LRATIGSEAVAAVEAEWDEMLDEIERLRQIIRNDHMLDDLDGYNPKWPDIHTWWCACGESGPGRRPSALHAAHVEAIMNGGVK